MSLTALETTRLLFALVVMMSLAHAFGLLFASLRQPRVIGEIFGGFLLGKSVLGKLAPSAASWLFPPGGVTSIVLGTCYQLGLLLLMFCSGTQIKHGLDRGERRSALSIAGTGMLLPFAAALAFVSVWDPTVHMGAAQHRGAFTLVFAVAMAVTSIPVISRILIDLGLIETSFARVLLGAAVIEDAALYVAVSVALGMVGAGGGAELGLPAALGIEPSSAQSSAYHTVASVAFFGAALACGSQVYGWLLRHPLNILHRASPGGWLLAYLMALSAFAAVLGVAPMLGAFVAGMTAARHLDGDALERDALQRFSFALFVPLYFAIVGYKLDAWQPFDLLFFLVLVTFACVVKVSSVYLGARVARECPRSAMNLGIAMNARGGPCIVLAAVALDAHIIDGTFYLHLILLAVITSTIAGSWLQHQMRLGLALR